MCKRSNDSIYLDKLQFAGSLTAWHRLLIQSLDLNLEVLASNISLDLQSGCKQFTWEGHSREMKSFNLLEAIHDTI